MHHDARVMSRASLKAETYGDDCEGEGHDDKRGDNAKKENGDDDDGQARGVGGRAGGWSMTPHP